VKNEWFKKGSVFVSLGSYQECDEDIPLTADKIIVDSWAQCSHRGELAKLAARGSITEKSIYAELGEIVAGKKQGRTNKEERILAVPIGLGSLDIALAKKVVEKARELGVGSTFSFL
jgi:ornithine cyclodeaminase/alanine dehydrogenase